MTNANGAPRTSAKTMAWDFCDGVNLVVHAETAPTDEEWGAYIADCLEHLGSLRGAIIMSEGAGPDVNQRERTPVDRFREIPVAVVTRSIIARGIATALRWRGFNTRAYLPTHLDGALEHAGVVTEERKKVRTRLSHMRRSLLGEGLEALLREHCDNDAYLIETPLRRIREQMREVQQQLGDADHSSQRRT